MENAEVYYIVAGGVLFAAYMLIYLLRVKRSRRVEEYMKELHSEHTASEVTGEPQIKGARREDVQRDSDK